MNRIQQSRTKAARQIHRITACRVIPLNQQINKLPYHDLHGGGNNNYY